MTVDKQDTDRVAHAGTEQQEQVTDTTKIVDKTHVRDAGTEKEDERMGLIIIVDEQSVIKTVEETAMDEVETEKDDKIRGKTMREKDAEIVGEEGKKHNDAVMDSVTTIDENPSDKGRERSEKKVTLDKQDTDRVAQEGIEQQGQVMDIKKTVVEKEADKVKDAGTKKVDEATDTKIKMDMCKVSKKGREKENHEVMVKDSNRVGQGEEELTKPLVGASINAMQDNHSSHHCIHRNNFFIPVIVVFIVGFVMTVCIGITCSVG